MILFWITEILKTYTVFPATKKCGFCFFFFPLFIFFCIFPSLKDKFCNRQSFAGALFFLTVTKTALEVYLQ